ncbi:MAG TPA: type II toxin-antitoxin system RelE/ParE family toxin [Candidatus Limnocylindria bacterium]|nr:type II toxin-antitoxin system RelE/ParE family toxin [Candidatus Limnocylindria bacterium]
MAYRIVYKKSVQRDLKKLGKAQASHVLDQIEKDLINHPDSFPTLKGQFAGLRKYHIGDYRVIYVILDEDVVILRIGHRREVYKK